MLQVVADLAAIYIYSFLTGLGLFLLLTPSFFRRHSFGAILVPALGLVQLTIASAYLIFLSVSAIDALYVSMAVGGLTLIAAAFKDKSILRYDIAGRLRAIVKLPPADMAPVFVTIMCFAALLGVVMAPVIRAGMPTTPYRIGIDQVGYAETSQYLLEGGTLAKIRETLLTRLHTSDIVKAKAQNIRALNFQTYVDSEFLLKASRWGYPGAVAALTFLTNSSHVYRIEFLLDVFSYAMLLGLSFLMLQEYFLLPRGVSLWITAALALNCNILNVYYEGQLTQVFMLPYFTMALLLYLYARRFAGETRLRLLVSGDAGRSLLLLGLVVAFMFSAYNEALVLLLAFIVLASMLDLPFYRTFRWRALLYALVGVAAGFVLVFPFSYNWLFYTIANLRGLATAGFWQPHWASFAEILGLMNMYNLPRIPPIAGIGVGYILMDRTALNLVLSIVLSVVLAAAFLFFVLRRHTVDRSFWLAPCVIILAAYLKMKYLDHILNYPYFKIYTMLAPLLCWVAFTSVYDLARSRDLFERVGRSLAKRGGVWRSLAAYIESDGQFIAKYLQAAMFVTVIITGLVYIRQYVVQSGYVNADMFALYKFSNGQRQFDRFALLIPRQQPSIADFMLTPLVSLNLVNQNDAQKYVAPYLQAPLAVVFSKNDVHCRECFLRRFARHIVYANPSYIVMDTGLKLRNICTKDADRYTLAALDTDNRGNWPDLPPIQCDYEFAAKYLTYAR